MTDIFDLINHNLSGGVDFKINFDTKENRFIDLCPNGWIKLWWLTQKESDFKFLDYIYYLYWNKYIDPKDVEIFWAIHNDELHKYIQTFSSGIFKWKRYNTEKIFKNIDIIKKMVHPDTVLAMKARISCLDFYKLLEINARDHLDKRETKKNIIVQWLWESIKIQTKWDMQYAWKISLWYSGEVMHDDTMKVIIGFLSYLQWNNHLYIDSIRYYDYRCNIILSRIHNLTEDLFLVDHEGMISSVDFTEDSVLINGFSFRLDSKFIYWEVFILICKYFHFFKVKEVEFSDLYSFFDKQKGEFTKLTSKNCIQDNFYRNYISAINRSFSTVYGLELLDMNGSLIKAKDIVGRKKKHPEEK